jgi:hypothetical protein
VGDADGRPLAAGVRLSGKELIVYAITGERRAVVRKLDALVKGYKPMYEFHGGPEAIGDLAPHLPLTSPPSNSVH